jgi:hypothetical protein
MSVNVKKWKRLDGSLFQYVERRADGPDILTPCTGVGVFWDGSSQAMSHILKLCPSDQLQFGLDSDDKYIKRLAPSIDPFDCIKILKPSLPEITSPLVGMIIKPNVYFVIVLTEDSKAYWHEGGRIAHHEPEYSAISWKLVNSN